MAASPDGDRTSAGFPPGAAPIERAEAGLRRAILVIAIGLSALLGYFTTFVLIFVIALAALYLLLRRDLIPVRLDGVALMFFAAFCLLFVPAVVTAREPADLLQTVSFVTMLAYAPLAALFRRAAGPGNSRKIADFALFGTAAGLLVSMYFTYVEHQPRAALGAFFTDPIRLANTALITGFLAMVGAAATTGRPRFVYFLGPLMALAVIFSTGSRAALIGFALLLFVAALMLVRRRMMALGVSVAMALGIVAVAYLADIAGSRTSTLLDIFSRLAAGDDPADLGTNIRFILYRAGWSSFLDAPLFGHGWGRLMSSIIPYLAPEHLVHASLPHLHDDGLNFAVASGGFGLGTYALLLVIPIVGGLASPRDSQYRARLYGCMLLVVSYFVLGLPDTMLSFPLHNALYVVLTAMLCNYCRDERGARPAVPAT